MNILLWDAKLYPYIDTLKELLDGDVSVVDAAHCQDVPAAVQGSDVIISSTLDAHLATQAKRLRLLHAAGVGTDGIAFDALGPDVRVATTGHHEESIAEYVVMALIALQRDIRSQDAALRTGKWASAGQDPRIPQPARLKGRVVTFLGFGAVGQASWRALRHFGAEGIAITRSGSTDAVAHGLRWSGRNAELQRALQESDVLVVSIPLGADTRGTIGTEQLAALGSNGLVVNVALGPVVDEHALFAALEGRTIAGAAIDVWYRYPGPDGNAHPSDLPFGSVGNVIMTPHSSGVTQQTFQERVVAIAENINRFVQGEPLVDEVTR